MNIQLRMAGIRFSRVNIMVRLGKVSPLVVYHMESWHINGGSPATDQASIVPRKTGLSMLKIREEKTAERFMFDPNEQRKMSLMFVLLGYEI